MKIHWLVQTLVSIALVGASSGAFAEPNPENNVYFGDTHVHTALSFDSYLLGNRLGLEDAYKFAQGKAITLSSGDVKQLDRPLDFVALADHAESYGLFVTCQRPDLTKKQRKFCEQFDSPSFFTFMKLRNEALQRPPVRSQRLCGGDFVGTCVEDAKTTWRQVHETADLYNQPGEFTTFAAYEYSPVLPDRGKLHRVVLFKNSEVPDRALSAYEATTVLDLWGSLESECKGNCEFLTIPHNMNRTWGLAYSGTTIDGDAYNSADWALRGRSEPLAEIFQVKGSSECGYGVGASDEECNFELHAPICDDDETIGCSGRTSFAREGLKIGLELEERLGFNPLQFGFIGSTDTHKSNAGDVKENKAGNEASVQEKLAKKRLGYRKWLGYKGLKPAQLKSAGGLAAVWAAENTREAIFDAMKRRETYATSGSRIKLRFFGGWDYPQALLDDNNMIAKAYQNGVPMGGTLFEIGSAFTEKSKSEKSKTPEFLIWAVKDSMGNNLQRVQMVKGWMEKGKSKEQVFDIACSDGLSPDPESGRCPDNGASVDISNCAVTPGIGDSEIKVRWRDPDFNPEQSAFYYVRVLENPSCRWSTYDAVRLGVEPRDDIPATIRERAWSSPIWYTP